MTSRVQIFTDQIVGHEQWIYGIYDVDLIFDLVIDLIQLSGDIFTVIVLECVRTFRIK